MSVVLSAILLTACSSDDSSQGKVGLISADISSCKTLPDEPSATRAGDGEEDRSHHLEYEIGKDSRLYLKDVNHYVPCNMTAFDVDATVKGDTITVTEKKTTGDVVSTCTCPIDVDLVIGLPEQKTYTLVYAVEGLVPENFTITNSPILTGRFDLKGVVMPKFDMEVDGIYYNIISSEEQTVEVTNRAYYGGYLTGYEGDVVIPEQVTYKGKSYRVTNIGQYVFLGNSLISIILPNTIMEINGGSLFAHCYNLVSVRLPRNITIIPEATFYDCACLREIFIPKGVTKIGRAAFVDCPSLTKIYSLNSIAPQADSYSFGDNVKQDAVLYVPVGSKDSYSTAEYWKDFAHIEEYDFSAEN